MTRHLHADDDVEALRSAWGPEQGKSNAAPPPCFQSKSLEELMSLNVTEPSELIGGVLPTPGAVLIVGAKKSGKTVLGVQIGICIAAGEPYLRGQCKVNQHGPVLVIEQDDPSGDASLQLMVQKSGIPMTGRPFRWECPKDQVLGPEFLSTLESEIRQHGFRYVMIDSYTAIRQRRKAGGDIVKDEMEDFRSLDELAKRTNCTVAILHHISHGNAAKATVHPHLRWVVERLLSKDPAERYDSTRDLYRELKQARERFSEARISSGESVRAMPIAMKRRIARPIIFGFACAAAGAVLTLALLPLPPDDTSKYQIRPITRAQMMEREPQWSPDGKSIAYVGGIHGIRQTFTKTIGASNAAQLTHSLESCNWPFWSPDGRTIYYTIDSGLWAIGASGGTSALVVGGASAAAIHPDGRTIALVRTGKLWIGELKSHEFKQFGENLYPGAVGSTRLQFSPDGSQLAVLQEDAPATLRILAYPTGASSRIGAYRTLSLRTLSLTWLPDSRRVVVNSGPGISVLDTRSGSLRPIYRSITSAVEVAAAPDGKSIAFTQGNYEWNVVEIGIPTRIVHTVVAEGGAAWWPSWAPSGSHFLYSTDRDGTFVIEDRSINEEFSRGLAEAAPGYPVDDPHWSPDGMRFLFFSSSPEGTKLMLSDATGGGTTPLDSGVLLGLATWSPDGQWVAYGRVKAGSAELVKIRPGSDANPMVLANGSPRDHRAGMYVTMQWSPTGDWILYPSKEGLSIISSDGRSVRKVTSREFSVYGFSKDGSQLFGIYRDPNPKKC